MPQQTDHLDFVSFTGHAVREAQRRLPGLDPEAMRLVLTLHRLTSLVVYDLESTVHRPRGWTWAGFRLLFALWIVGPMSPKRAAEIAGMSRAAVSSLVNTLERAGLVTRSRNGSDGRSVVLRLTDAGRAAIGEAFAAHNTREQMWAGALDPQERRTLVELLDKIISHLDDTRIRRRD